MPHYCCCSVTTPINLHLLLLCVYVCLLQAVAGLSKRQLAALQGSNPPAAAAAAAAASRPDHSSGAGRDNSLLCSLPVAVLADPSPNRPQAGIVLSVAPLLGAHPYTDQGVAKWLHVHVRPSVRGLLRVIKVGQGRRKRGWGRAGAGVRAGTVEEVMRGIAAGSA
jgi:hypothetical protein